MVKARLAPRRFHSLFHLESSPIKQVRGAFCRRLCELYNGLPSSRRPSLNRSQHPGAARCRRQHRRPVPRRAKRDEIGVTRRRGSERERKRSSVSNSKSNEEHSEPRERPRDAVRAFEYERGALCASRNVRATRGSLVSSCFFSWELLFCRSVSAISLDARSV